jgi:uncharacterized protein YhhL (DUF1145 family)
MLSNDTTLATVFTDDDGHIFACNDLDQYECETSSKSMIRRLLSICFLSYLMNLFFYAASILLMIHLGYGVMMHCSEMKSVSKRLSVTRRIPKAQRNIILGKIFSVFEDFRNSVLFSFFK